jgi:hypothetical protein
MAKRRVGRGRRRRPDLHAGRDQAHLTRHRGGNEEREAQQQLEHEQQEHGAALESGRHAGGSESDSLTKVSRL